MRHSVNGVPTGTTYTVGFGDNRSMAVCETRQEQVFDRFIQCLFKAVGFRILVETPAEIGKGKTVRVGDAIVGDNGIVVPRHALFGSSNPVALNWNEARVWTADGSFYVGSKADKKAYARCRPTTDNVHLLERAIRMSLVEHGGSSQSSSE